ncbi:hypothetical protein MSAN_00049200 [Mycena sanguinolenta]|uniref:Uncharacterized protein n=1 Tax=Mycena sanguinolenta TaxID=230812 RepID=A0A8H6ZER2_9AGAR|nr:hypothetical protein MSAN_00049200 [Mycena sanguinolenta]
MRADALTVSIVATARVFLYNGTKMSGLQRCLNQPQPRCPPSRPDLPAQPTVLLRQPAISSQTQHQTPCSCATTQPRGAPRLLIPPLPRPQAIPWPNPPPTLRDDRVEYTFQILGIAAAMVFGVWSVKSYSTSVTANSLSVHSNDIAQAGFQQTIYQNQLALLAFCVANTDAGFNETCAGVLDAMSSGGFQNITDGILSPTPAGPAPKGPSRELSFHAIVVVIVVAVVLAGFASAIFQGRNSAIV